MCFCPVIEYTTYADLQTIIKPCMRIKLERSNLIVISEYVERRPLCVHALITSLSMCKWYLGKKKRLGIFFFGFFFLNQSRRRKPCSKQDYQCTFPPVPSPACSALLCSFTTPSLLSVCLSLQQKHSSGDCGGMGAQTQSLSLSLPPANIELRCTG